MRTLLAIAILVVIVVVFCLIRSRGFGGCRRALFGNLTKKEALAAKIITKVLPIFESGRHLKYAEFMTIMGDDAEAVTYSDLKKLYRLGKISSSDIMRMLM
jgi:hypothetical protein